MSLGERRLVSERYKTSMGPTGKTKAGIDSFYSLLLTYRGLVATFLGKLKEGRIECLRRVASV